MNLAVRLAISISLPAYVYTSQRDMAQTQILCVGRRTAVGGAGKHNSITVHMYSNTSSQRDQLMCRQTVHLTWERQEQSLNIILKVWSTPIQVYITCIHTHINRETSSNAHRQTTWRGRGKITHWRYVVSLCKHAAILVWWLKLFLHVLGREEKRLTIWDLHYLLFLLANVATKWRMVRDILCFPKHMLDTIGQKVVCITEDLRPMECLRKMLALWLGPDKPPDCDPTTVHVLAMALRHPSVNEGQLANRIERWPAGTSYVLQSHWLTSMYCIYIATAQIRLFGLTYLLSLLCRLWPLNGWVDYIAASYVVNA